MSGGCWIVHDFVSGKARSRRGPARPRRFETVTVVARDRVDDLLGTRGQPEERTRLLRGLRDQGLLVAHRGRLTHRVRTGRGDGARAEKRAAYVFACPDPAYVEQAVAQLRRSGRTRCAILLRPGESRRERL